MHTDTHPTVPTNSNTNETPQTKRQAPPGSSDRADHLPTRTILKNAARQDSDPANQLVSIELFARP